jgi:hypothetical protein
MVRLPGEVLRDQRLLDALGKASVRIAGGIGASFLLLSILIGLFVEGASAHFWRAYLFSFAYFLSLSLGALFFVLLQHLTKSTWSVVVRRFAEGIAMNLELLAFLFVPVLLFGLRSLYPWADPSIAGADATLAGKRSYLNVPFFSVRILLYFAVWWMTARSFYRRSLEQDASGSVALTRRMERASAPSMLLFALATTFAAFDLLMSLDPHWYSTIFGVYFFSGSVLGFFALLIVVSCVTQRAGRMRHMITAEHYHDLGKLLFAFTVFWAYIAFSQYMLIWYADIPEETSWYLTRQTGGWASVSLVLLFGHFVVPFLALLSRAPKRRNSVLVQAALWLLAMHGVDLYYLVAPGTGARALPPHPLYFTLFLAMGGLSIAVAGRRFTGRSLVPEKDPRLEESIAFENA